MKQIKGPVLGVSVLMALMNVGVGSSHAQQVLAHADHQQADSQQQSDLGTKPAIKPAVRTAAVDPSARSGDLPSISVAKPTQGSQTARGVQTQGKGPYYVDFRARTAASYGHAFIWFGKTSEKKVDVAGLHPAGDELPYILGHLTWVPSETGASYGDLDEQYLTASYRVYMSEADSRRVFAYIRHLQATSPLWNAETTNCTAFIGKIATFMGMKVPFHLQKPENYVNQLKALNGGRRMVQLGPVE